MIIFTLLILLWSFWTSASQGITTAFGEGSPTLYEGEVMYPSLERELRHISYQELVDCLALPKDEIAKVETCLNRFREMSFVAEAILTEENGRFQFRVNITKLSILTRNADQFKDSDWCIAAMCLYLMHDSVIEAHIHTAARIVGGLLKMHNTCDAHFSTRRKFEEVVEKCNHSITVVTQNLAIVTWYPFQSDFNGIAWYRGYNATSDGYIQKMSPNWTIDSINKENLIMALYVPNGFIETLTANSESNELRDLFIILTMTKEDGFLVEKFFSEIYDIISIKVPGFCKTNELPILKVLYEDDARVYEYGNKYFDSPNRFRESCMLSTTTYFARIKNDVHFFDSAQANYCLRYRSGNTYFPQSLSGGIAYPENFCVNKDAEIPHLRCNYIKKPSWVNENSMDLECGNNYSISAHTYQIYKFATQCWNIKNFGDVLIEMSSTNLETIDKKMFFDVLKCIVDLRDFEIEWLNSFGKLVLDNDAFLNGMSIALEFAKELPKEFIKATNISDILVSWMFLKYLLDTKKYVRKTNDNYIYQQILRDSVIIGIVVYRRGNGSFKDYEVKSLTKDNATRTLTLDQSVEAVVYVSNTKLAHYGLAFLYFPYTRLSVNREDSTITPQSRSLVVYSWPEMEFDVFLRIVDNEDKWILNYYTGEGYWFRTSVYGAAVTYIVKNSTRNNCESLKSVEIEEFIYPPIPESLQDLPGKTIQKKIDLLSMLSMSVNTAEGKTGTEEIYNKYSLLLKIFRMLGSTFSLLGVIILFTTALALKNWHKTRFYTIQLAITLTLQVVFFIAETQIDEIHQVGFFIFYYFILSQFFWMSLIGYVQYMRYVKIFQSRKLGIVKSLIVGWLFPAIVIASSLIIYFDCLKCKLCYKNKDIFIFFVLVPMGVVVAVNLIVYIFAMINIWSSQGGVSLASDRKLKIRASIFLPFFMGITWLFVFAVLSPWSWLFVAGLLFIHLIVPSQAIILCVFVVLLDKPTRQQWKSQIRDILKNRK